MMRTLRMLWARVRGQAAQGREDRAFEEEIREHIALLEDRYRLQGMSAQEAARAARRQFGNVTALKERQRAQRGILSLAEWWRDVRFGFRMLAKRPVSSAAVVVALALGIGLNSAVFTFVNALLLRPPQGVSGTNKLVEVWLHNPKTGGVEGYLPFNYPDYAYYRDHTKSLDGLMAFDGDGEDVIWNHAGTGEILHAHFVSGNLFSLLGLNAVVGRMLSADDDRIDNPRQVVVLSYPFWKQKLGGDTGVIGKTLMLDGRAFMVVLLAAFACLALLLTLVGLYGVMAYSVTRRTREIGVRLALGALRWTVLRMVLQQAALLILIGSGLGIAAALASGSMLQAFLYGTGARNPVVLATVCGLVAVAGLLAAYLPARKAMRVDPSVALRYE